MANVSSQLSTVDLHYFKLKRAAKLGNLGNFVR